MEKNLNEIKERLILENTKKVFNTDDDFFETPVFFEIFGKSEVKQEDLSKYTIEKNKNGFFEISYKNQGTSEKYITNKYGVVEKYILEEGYYEEKISRENGIIKRETFSYHPLDGIGSTDFYIDTGCPIKDYSNCDDSFSIERKNTPKCNSKRKEILEKFDENIKGVVETCPKAKAYYEELRQRISDITSPEYLRVMEENEKLTQMLTKSLNLLKKIKNHPVGKMFFKKEIEKQEK